MEQNTQQPAWWHARINGAHDALFNELPPDDAYDEGTLTALYTAPTVPRDVLMAALEDCRKECATHYGSEFEDYEIDIAAIADRYASQLQPEPVNQQMLEALKNFVAEELVGVVVEVNGEHITVRCVEFFRQVRAAIAAAEKEQGHD